MDRPLAALARLVSIVALGAGSVAIAAAEDLEGFVLKDWNKMSCTPEALREGSTLNVMLPRGPSEYLSILAPGGRYFSLVLPGPVVEGMPTSDALANMPALSIDTSTAKGVVASAPERIFTQTGTYVVLAGTQFETERPITHGWCRVTYKALG